MNGIELDRDESRNGKVLYDYEALNDQELSITTDQVSTKCCLVPNRVALMHRILLSYQFRETRTTLWLKLMESMVKSLPIIYNCFELDG